jgi:AraC-like DNA-binding protein
MSKKEFEIRRGGSEGQDGWFGSLFYWLSGLLMERVLFVCYALKTTLHSVPVPKIYVLLEGDLSVETIGWVGRSESGAEECLPTSDMRRTEFKSWRRRVTRLRLLPGQLVFIKSGFSHRLIGEGKVAILFLPPDSVEGQHALARGDYHAGLAVAFPPKARMEALLGKLASLLDVRRGGMEEAAAEAYEAVSAMIAPPSAPSRIMPWPALKTAKTVRAVCRLDTFERYSHRRIRLEPMARLLGLEPKELERVFREHVLTRPCFYVPFLRHAASMLYFFARKHQALIEHKILDLKVGHLAKQVWYSSQSQFSKQFRRLHGITAETFIKSDISFFPINMDSD